MKKKQFSKSLSVALSEEHFEMIKQITDEEQISMAEWVRNAVELKLEKQNQTGESENE